MLLADTRGDESSGSRRISGRKVSCEMASPPSTRPSSPDQTGSSCSTESTPSKPTWYRASTIARQSIIPRPGTRYRYQPLSQGLARWSTLPNTPTSLRAFSSISTSLAWACTIRSGHPRSAAIGSMPSQVRCEGS